jgi:hypothetical protein
MEGGRGAESRSRAAYGTIRTGELVIRRDSKEAVEEFAGVTFGW